MESEKKGEKIHVPRERIPGKSEKILISFFTLQFPQRNTSIQHKSHRMTPSSSPLQNKERKVAKLDTAVDFPVSRKCEKRISKAN
ncbi:hypothetical protein CEXT_647941 [Caerostris extrusa]|uniref:Uncharacterized protein n=1 Tax=Caerostris extrusa TaxID=172846 RepID=A0AAV4Q0J4_CAEEX|nr:hypothetical protein CEXT_647941 [Caerostris extrusa]